MNFNLLRTNFKTGTKKLISLPISASLLSFGVLVPTQIIFSDSAVANPTLTSVSPTGGSTAGGTAIKIYGSFPTVLTTTITVGGANCTSITTLNLLSLEIPHNYRICREFDYFHLLH